MELLWWIALSVRTQYGELKKMLAIKYRNGRDGYTDAKTEFVRRISDLARQEQMISENANQ